MNFLRNQTRRFDSVTVRCECPDGSTIEVKVSWTDRVSSICAEVERLKGIHEDAQELTQNGRNLMHGSKILSSKIDPDVPIKVAVDRDIGFPETVGPFALSATRWKGDDFRLKARLEATVGGDTEASPRRNSSRKSSSDLMGGADSGATKVQAAAPKVQAVWRGRSARRLVSETTAHKPTRTGNVSAKKAEVQMVYEMDVEVAKRYVVVNDHENTGKISGELSPASKITLSKEEREAVGVPEEATRFALAYPIVMKVGDEIGLAHAASMATGWDRLAIGDAKPFAEMHVGERYVHEKHGPGKVLEKGASGITMKFDIGETHTYKPATVWKLLPMAEEDHDVTTEGDCTAAFNFLTGGGYVYLDDASNVVKALALTPSHGHGGLIFGGHRRCRHEWTEALVRAGRFAPVTIRPLLDRGATHFCWLTPNEKLKDADGTPLRYQPTGTEEGAFVYLFHTKSLDFEKNPPSERSLQLARFFPIIGAEKQQEDAPVPFRLVADDEPLAWWQQAIEGLIVFLVSARPLFVCLAFAWQPGNRFGRVYLYQLSAPEICYSTTTMAEVCDPGLSVGYVAWGTACCAYISVVIGFALLLSAVLTSLVATPHKSRVLFLRNRKYAKSLDKVWKRSMRSNSQDWQLQALIGLALCFNGVGWIDECSKDSGCGEQSDQLNQPGFTVFSYVCEIFLAFSLGIYFNLDKSSIPGLHQACGLLSPFRGGLFERLFVASMEVSAKPRFKILNAVPVIVSFVMMELVIASQGRFDGEVFLDRSVVLMLSVLAVSDGLCLFFSMWNALPIWAPGDGVPVVVMVLRVILDVFALAATSYFLARGGRGAGRAVVRRRAVLPLRAQLPRPRRPARPPRAAHRKGRGRRGGRRAGGGDEDGGLRSLDGGGGGGGACHGRGQVEVVALGALRLPHGGAPGCGRAGRRRGRGGGGGAGGGLADRPEPEAAAHLVLGRRRDQGAEHLRHRPEARGAPRRVGRQHL